MSETKLKYGEEIIPFTITPSTELRTRIRIHVHPSGTVEVEAPEGIDPETILFAAQKRARWIVGQRSKIHSAMHVALPRHYVTGETHFYLGRRYVLKIVQDRQTESCVKLIGGNIMVTLPLADPAAIKRRLNEWYREKATAYFRRRLELICHSITWLDLPPNFQLRTMKKRWGSCAANGQLTLNPALIRAPRNCIDYVLTHEICHIKEHSHDPSFYKLMDRHNPGWRSSKRELDDLSELLLPT